MITLITGLPGEGKTLYALWWTKARAEKEGRQVYYSGITDLRIPGWIEFDAEKWHELPAGAIIVIDEVQRVMRPRQHGSKVPDHVAMLETHRHQGKDLVLITQHPMLLDQNARRLVKQHFHVVRKFGTEFATVHEWAELNENPKRRDESIRHQWSYPTEAFGWYKSAELHTVKRRIPMKVWMLVGSVFLLIFLAWRGMVMVKEGFGPKGTGDQVVKPNGKPNTPSTGGLAVNMGGPGGAAAAAGGGQVDPNEYFRIHQPRVAGLAYTAPVYDGVTAPAHAPYPAACVQKGDECRCYSQQATRLEVPGHMCQAIVAGGFFVAWQQLQAAPSPAPVASAATRPQEATEASAGVATIGKPPAAPPAPSTGDLDDGPSPRSLPARRPPLT